MSRSSQPQGRRPASRSLLVVALIGAAAAGLALHQGPAPTGWAAVVVSVGLAVALLGAAVASPPMADRLMLLSLAWSAGSLVPWLATLQRGAVVVVIAAGVLPDLRRAPRRWGALLLCAALLAAPGLPLGAAACLLLLAAGLLAAQSGRNSLPAAIGLLLVAAGQAAAAVLVAVGPAAADVGRLCYAAGFVGGVLVATLASGRDPARTLTGAWPGPEDLAGVDPVEAVEAVLRQTLADATLQVRPAHDEGTPGARCVEVDGSPWVWISSDRAVLNDADTWHAVAQLVAQVGAHQRLVQAEQLRAIEVAKSRARLLAAADDERQELAQVLRSRVLGPLREAAGLLTSAPQLAAELESAARDIEVLLIGQSPFRLGGGAVRDALADLAARSPVTVRLHGEGLSADEATERAIWAVAAESLTNAWKHARATVVDIRLAPDGAMLLVQVDDDGIGGADPSGQGLLGLADRVAALGGSFSVGNRNPRGTSVRARLPLHGVTSMTPAVVGASSAGSRP